MSDIHINDFEQQGEPRITRLENKIIALEDKLRILEDAIKHNAKVVTEMRDSAITIMPQAILRDE